MVKTSFFKKQGIHLLEVWSETVKSQPSMYFKEPQGAGRKDWLMRWYRCKPSPTTRCLGWEERPKRKRKMCTHNWKTNQLQLPLDINKVDPLDFSLPTRSILSNLMFTFIHVLVTEREKKKKVPRVISYWRDRFFLTIFKVIY